MKILSRIFYYSILTVIILATLYNFLQKAIISPILIDNIVKKIGPAVRADNFDIESISLGLNRIYVKNIIYEKENVSVVLKDFTAEVSITETLSGLIRFKGLMIRAQSVKIDGCDISINPEMKPSGKTDWDFDFDDFRQIVSFLNENDYVKSIEIGSVNLTYVSDTGLELIRNMNGKAEYSENDEIVIDLRGMFLNSETENVFLKGVIDNSDYSADIDLKFGSDDLSDFRSPFGFYRITDGRYSGNAKLEINRRSEGEFFMSGNFNLSDLDAVFNNNMRIEDAGIDISYFNGMISLADLQGTLNGLPFRGKGRIFNMMYPNGDIFLDFRNLSGQEIKNAVIITGAPAVMDRIVIGDDNSLELHVSGELLKPSISFKLNSGSALVYENQISDIHASGTFRSGDIIIKEAGLKSADVILSLSGNVNRIFLPDRNYNIGFKGTGALFKSLKFLNSAYLKEQSTLISGNINGDFSGLPEIRARINAYDFKNRQDEKTLTVDAFVNNGKTGVSIFDREMALLAEGEYVFTPGQYSLSGKNFMSFYELIYGKKILPDEKNIYFNISGDSDYFAVNAGSDDPNSVFFGQLNAKFDLNQPVLQTFVNWMPNDNNSYARPANFRIMKNNRILSLSDIYFDSKKVAGSVTLNLLNMALAGEIDAEKVDFGSFFRLDNLSTRTDLSLRMKGFLPDVRTDIYINENILKYRGYGDSIAIAGDAHAVLEGKNLGIERLKLYSGLENILSVEGEIKEFKNIDISTEGKISADMFNVFLKDIDLTGDIDYKAEFTGNRTDIRIRNSVINVENASVNKDRINSVKIKTSEFDSTGVLVNQFKVDAGRFLNLDAEGFLPYDDSDIYITGEFYGDLLGYLASKTSILTRATSEFEGRFTIDGKYKKPKIRDMELYILDGRVIPKGSPAGFNSIRSKIVVDENSNLKIIDFSMNAVNTGGLVKIRNAISEEGYGDIILPGGINMGNLSLLFDDRGIDFHAFRMMLPDDYGNFVLKGKNDDRFRIHKRDSRLVAEGRGIVRDAKITFPFLKTAGPKKEMSDFLKSIELDVELIPGSGNSYFYNLDMEEKSIWSRIVRSFRRLDDDLNNVLVNITPNNEGLMLKIPLGDPKKLVLTGELSGRNGTCNYSAFTFRVNEVSITFDENKSIFGKTDPYLKASGKTTVKTKADSTGFSGYEDIYLKVVTKEDGEVVDSEGARISNLSIILTDQYGNLWLEQEGKLSEIDTRGTMMEMFNEAVDARVLSPFISPIESAIGRFLGASVSIRPTISRNFIDRELGLLEVPESYAEYFLGSEFYISKFLTDNLALTWNSQYIGSEEYIEITEREYGYKNKLSFDYRLNNYVFTSAGYQYDSIQDEYGYNLALTYRYRFFNISEPYNYIKNFLRLK
ncbi:MAG: hypothetical protein JXN63_07165 [Candidatus Delongbacteria bacterium]|nr:hypothetical protein [Candidatus Delongbacteria bacterium]